MTSFAFIFGVLPLAIRPALARTAASPWPSVIGGMLTATILAIFTSLFFVLVRRGVCAASNISTSIGRARVTA
jgi:multidrug efflux pump subunit AcrB